jgi:hypothetical protein
VSDTLAGKYNAIESLILIVVLLTEERPCKEFEFLLDLDKSGSPVPELVPVVLLLFTFNLFAIDFIPTSPYRFAEFTNPASAPL